RDVLDVPGLILRHDDGRWRVERQEAGHRSRGLHPRVVRGDVERRTPREVVREIDDGLKVALQHVGEQSLVLQIQQRQEPRRWSLDGAAVQAHPPALICTTLRAVSAPAVGLRTRATMRSPCSTTSVKYISSGMIGKRVRIGRENSSAMMSAPACRVQNMPVADCATPMETTPRERANSKAEPVYRFGLLAPAAMDVS